MKFELIFLLAQVFSLIYLLEAADEKSCELNGNIYEEYEDFTIGENGCSKCTCINGAADCDLTKCQEIQTNTNLLMNEKSSVQFDDFTNIKNQIANKYYADFDENKLKIILDALGCRSIDCHQLLSATNIEYNLLEAVGKRYAGRGDRLNKIVIQSTDTEVMNSSPSEQKITSVSYFLKCIQTFELTITKTTQTYSDKKLNLWLYKRKSSVTFTRKEVETYHETNETTIVFPKQNITVAPFTKMNITFNFFQYDDINNYFMDFEIALNSTIAHPDVGANSEVVFVKKPLGDFLQKHVSSLSTLKYANDSMIKLEAIDDKFILKNFPSTEKITGYGVDVVFGKVEKV